MVQHLSDEFQAVVRERQSFLDRALGQLQYQRELSRLQLLHTQVLTLDVAKEICMSFSHGGFREKLPKEPRGTGMNQARN